MRSLLALALLLPLAAAAEPAADRWPALEQRWTLRNAAAAARNPVVEVPVFDPASFSLKPRRLYDADWSVLQEHSLRNDGGLGGQEGLRLEWNLLAVLGFSQAPSPLPKAALPAGRHAALQARLLDETTQRLEVEIDQLALRWQSERLSLAAGRQSVNLGENFHFSPLDFFLPFIAQQSYRDFRPGVDAVRLSAPAGRFSLLELIAVAGYDPLLQGTNTRENALRVDGEKGLSSLLGRVQAGGASWSGVLLAGRVRQEAVGGAAVQLEWAGASWTLEGLQARALGMDGGRSEFTFGLTRQWNSWLNSRLEQNLALARGAGTEQRQDRGCLSLNLQASPLLTLGPAIFWYPTDRNGAVSLLAALSISDESVLELGLNAPLLFPSLGDGKPTPMDFAPSSFSVELRSVL